jgi:signal transduction histidine kinase/CheY-like chemotaxis protein
MTVSGPDQLRVLFVDGDEQRREALGGRLAAVSELQVDTAADITAATDRVSAGGVDCVVTDAQLPDGDAFDLLSAVRDSRPDIAVILSPVDGSESLAADALTAGVDGYRPRGGVEETCERLAGDIVAAVGKRNEQTGMLDRMTDAFFALDSSFRFTYANERARTILSEAMGTELTADELVGKHFREDLPEIGDAGFYQRYREAMSEREAVTFEEYYPPLDAWFEVRAYPTDGGLAVYFREVTDRRAYEQRLEHREAVLTEMHRIIADTERSFEEKVQELFTIGREELGTEYATLSSVQGEEYVFDYVQTPEGDDSIAPGDVAPLSSTSCERAIVTEQTLVIEDMATEPPEIADRAGNVNLGLCCYLGTPVLVDGEVSGTFCFYGSEPQSEPFSQWQVTLVELMGSWVSYERQRQRREAELTRERNRMEEFASVVSHDLRSPLSVARTRLELASDECDSDHLTDIDGALDRMEGVIDDVLALARLGQQVVDAEPTDIEPVARNAWESVSADDATLSMGDLPTVSGDASRLQRLFENLFRNAVEHGSTSPDSQARQDSVEHGSTNSRTQSDDTVEHGGPDVTVTVGALEDGFYVADDGPGIPEDEREDVFDHGHTSDEDGTGFGLSIVAQIAAAHGGSATVTESEAGGARFEIRGLETR